MILYTLSISVTLRAPFLIAGTERPVYGIDIFQIRNAAGLAIIPDTHFKGMLRHAWASALGTPPEDLFGFDVPVEASSLNNPEAAEDEPRQIPPRFKTEKNGRLLFNDLVAENTKREDQPRRTTRVSIDDATGAAKQGHLLTVEQVAPPRDTVTFTGTALLWAGSKAGAGSRTPAEVKAEALADAIKVAAGLQTAATHIAAIGRFKTVGYGEVVGITVAVTGSDAFADTATHTPARQSLTFGLSKPAMVAARYGDSNTLDSADRIPGGVIKGALAKHLQNLGYDLLKDPMAKALSALVIGEAVPTHSDPDLAYSSFVLPLDHVEFGKAPPVRWPGAPNFADPPTYADESNLPRFSGDMKTYVPPASLPRETRTRLAINEETQAARTGALFTQTLVREGGVTWTCTVDSSACAPSIELNHILNALLHGPTTLGKTNARMKPIKLAPDSATPPRLLGNVRVTIETPTLMIREKDMASPADYEKALRDYWKEATNNQYDIATETVDGLPDVPQMFVQMEFRGGFEARHYRYFGDDVVEPFVLTKPGSVFVLKPVGATDNTATLKTLVKTGLPVGNWETGALKTLSRVEYECCPFAPQNGYGAITLEDAP